MWWVDRRASRGETRFARLTFHRDGRFGAFAPDRRGVLWGGFGTSGLERARDGGLRGRVDLRFDHGGPERSFFASLAEPPVGPLVLSDCASPHVRIFAERAGATDAPLVGAWRAPAGAGRQGDSGIDVVELEPSGEFTLRLSGGVTRPGRWFFERESAPALGAVTGWLLLDPAETVFPLERWRVELRPGTPPRITIDRGHGPEVVLTRRAVEPHAMALLGAWRLVSPTDAGAPRELRFAPDGRFVVVHRAGAGSAGRWSFARGAPRFDALEGALTLTFEPHDRPASNEQWTAMLPFAHGAELSLIAHDGRSVRAYRRLFR